MITIKKFHADWCQPCKVLDKTLEDLKTQLNTSDFNFVYLNIDDTSNASEVIKYGVRSIPTLIIEKENKTTKLTGVKTRDEIFNAIISL